MAAVKDAPRKSQKHALIDRANQVALIALSAAVAILMFSLFATQALIRQNAYNQKVIGEKKEALKKIKQNRANVDSLVSAYKSFATEPINALGGNPAGEGLKDGDNPRIVLDALPSQYDFPGFASSMEKLIVTQGGLTIGNLGGEDNGDPTSSSSDGSADLSSSGPVAPVELTMQMSLSSDYQKIQTFIKTLEASIRPIYVSTVRIGGSDNSMELALDLKTFYQPEKQFNVTTKVVE